MPGGLIEEIRRKHCDVGYVSKPEAHLKWSYLSEPKPEIMFIQINLLC